MSHDGRALPSSERGRVMGASSSCSIHGSGVLCKLLLTPCSFAKASLYAFRLVSRDCPAAAAA